MYLIWIFGSKLIRSNNQSRATLWVLETCLIVGLLLFMIILITASSSSNTYNKASWSENWTFEGTWSILFKTLNIPWDRLFGPWLLSQFTTGCPVLWWFVSSSKLKFLLSREKRVWSAPLWGQTTGHPVLSWFGFGFSWVDWELFCLSSNFTFWLSSNFWTKIFHPVMFLGNLWRRTKWRKNLLVYDFSSFHPNNFRDTISWKCFVKNESVRSCLIERQSFLQSKVDVDPIHRILMLLPCFMHVLCKTRCFQVDRVRILVFFVCGIHRQKEYCLSVARILSSRYQSWIDDGM